MKRFFYGGVFFTGSSYSPDNPVFHEMNDNYNTLQFYTGDIHPDVELDQFMGGLQDNGTLLYQPGHTPHRGTKLSGGDGAFCFFDHDDPDFTITTVYYTSLYYWSVNPDFNIGFYGNLREGAGTFINPMDYDWKSNTMIFNVCNFTGDGSNCLGMMSLDIEQEEIHRNVLELNTNSSVPYSVVKWDEQKDDGCCTVYLGTASGKLFRLSDIQDTESLEDITGDEFPVANINCIDRPFCAQILFT